MEAVLIGFACLAAVPAQAQTTRIHTFPNSADPVSANFVQAADGFLYGVTRQGSGTNGYLFRLRPDGGDYQVVHPFTAAELGTGRPEFTLLYGADGAIYGTTEAGGSAGFGTIYRVNTDGSGFRVLHSFTAGTTSATFAGDGGAPRGGLVWASDGNLYGLTTRGTATPGATLNDSNGVIYRVAPDGSNYQVIYSFDQKLSAIGGIQPVALIQGRDGLLYGTLRAIGITAVGGIFSIAPDGSGFRLLTSFAQARAANGYNPRTPVVYSMDGFIYGTTFAGGARNGGTVFRLRPDGSSYQVMHSFSVANQSNGYNPADVFFQGRDGSLYGRTLEGGAFVNGEGDIYRIRPDGQGLRRLHSFDLGDTAPVAFQGADGALHAVGRVETGRTTVGNTTQITTANVIYRIVVVPGLEITQQPRSQVIAPGGIANFLVVAPGATTYQWQRNGTNIPGATADRIAIVNVNAAAHAGTYTVTVGNGNPDDSTTSQGAVLRVEAPNPGRLINLSVRTTAGTGAETLIAGFVVAGTGTKQVLVRAIGPSLALFGVTGQLTDPQLALFAGSNPLASNGGWGGTTGLATAFSQVGAFPLASTSRDAALLSPLGAGGYSAQVTPASGTTGVALLEAYDADPANSTARFVNLSARTVAGTGSTTLIAGFALSGNVPKTLLIRGIGPGLSQFGVTGTLSNPRLELHTLVNNQDTIVAANAGWGGSAALSAAFAQVGAFALPTNSADAALLISLEPGSYTAQVAGAGNTTGVALVEVYEVP